MMRLIHILGDRQAGFVLGLVVVLNLIVGSLVMNGYPELYPKFSNLDLNYFFQPIRGEHFWLYGLLLTFSLFGINLLACSIASIVRLLEKGKGRLKEIAALLFHLALLISMAAHLYEGFFASTQRVAITAEGTELPGLGMIRVESLRNIYYPDNSLKDTEVTLLFGRAGEHQIRKEISYNRPAIFDGGRRQVVMLGSEMTPVGVSVLREGDNEEFRFEEETPLALGEGSLVLQGVFQTRSGLRFAQFQWLSPKGDRQQYVIALDAGAPHSQITVDGVVYRFNEIIEAPLLVATVRYNPAIPLMVFGLMLASGATLMLMRWLARSKA